jgi:proteasome lid subunit RPN8/RPN11
MNEIRMAGPAEQSIRQHGAAAYPHECCGALLGRATESGKVVTEVVSIENARTDSRENRFLIEDSDYIRVEKEADRRGLALLGFYHSHPDHPAAPSRYDLEHAFPWFSYVIVAVHKGVPEAMTCWVLTEERDRFEEEPIARDSHARRGGDGPDRASEAMEGA